MQLQHATAVGSGILVSLKAIFPAGRFDLPHAPGSAALAKPCRFQAGGRCRPARTPSAAIILLTDGQTTAGPDPVDAARLAAERGVRVFTVGVGTDNGQILTGEGWSMRVRLDEEPLKAIADLTRAEYFYAGTAPDLKKVYESLALEAGDGEEGDRDHRALLRACRRCGAAFRRRSPCFGLTGSCKIQRLSWR